MLWPASMQKMVKIRTVTVDRNGRIAENIVVTWSRACWIDDFWR